MAFSVRQLGIRRRLAAPLVTGSEEWMVARRDGVSPTERRWFVPVTIVLGVLYIASRAWFVARFPYFNDEGQYATYTQQAASSLHQLFVSEGASPELPFFVWLGIPWVKLGLNPLTALRLVSVISGLLTIPVVGLLGRRLAGPLVGLVAAALCVVLPFFVVHDGIGIYEPLVTLEIAAALYLQIEHAQRPSIRRGALLGLVLAAGTLTKQNTEPAVLLVPISLLCLDWSPDGRRGRLERWLGGVVLAGVMVIGAALLLRSSHYWSEGQHFRKLGFYPARTIGQVLSDPFNEVPRHAAHVFADALLGYVTIPLLALGMVGAVLAVRSMPRLAAVLIVWIVALGGIAVMFVSNPYPRHVMYVMPAAIVLIAYAGVRAGRWLRGVVSARAAILVGAAASAAVLAPAAFVDARVLAHPATFRYPSLDYTQYVTGQPAGAPWPHVADAIRRRAASGQVVILTPQAQSFVLSLVLSGDPRYHVVAGSTPLAKRAQFAVYEGGDPFLDVAANAIAVHDRFTVVGRFPRPDGGAVTTLRQRPPG